MKEEKITDKLERMAVYEWKLKIITIMAVMMIVMIATIIYLLTQILALSVEL